MWVATSTAPVDWVGMQRLTVRVIQTFKQAAEEPDLIPLAVHPGWVRTSEYNSPHPPLPPFGVVDLVQCSLVNVLGMGGSDAEMSIEECVTPFIAFLKRASKEHAGKFFNNQGEPIPW